MWTAAQLVSQACEDAHVPGYIAQGESKLQLILNDLCFKGEYALARGAYYFPLNPANITTIGGIVNFGGPYPLPLDYLRTSGSSGSDGVQYAFFYVYNGVPYPLQPWDLGKLDMQVQQPGIQNLPYAYTTDISTESTAQDRIAAVTIAATTFGSAQIQLTLPPAGAIPAPVTTPEGWGIGSWGQMHWGAPVSDPAGNIVLPGSGNSIVGLSIAGLGIAPGSTVVTANASPDGLSAAVILSHPATGTFTAASVMLGTPPNAYVYPGPSGAFPTTVRYQRLMPPLIDFQRVPWFPDQEYLLEKLTAMMMSGADDQRRDGFFARSAMLLGKYETFSDDKTSRAQTVLLDRNRFGRAYNKLHNTKTIGW